MRLPWRIATAAAAALLLWGCEEQVIGSGTPPSPPASPEPPGEHDPCDPPPLHLPEECLPPPPTTPPPTEEPGPGPEPGSGMQPLPWDDASSHPAPECIVRSRTDGGWVLKNQCSKGVTVYYCRDGVENYECGDGFWASIIASQLFIDASPRTESLDAAQPYYTERFSIGPGLSGFLYDDTTSYAVCSGYERHSSASTGQFYYYGPDQFRSDEAGGYGCYPACPNGDDGSPGCRASCSDIDAEPWTCPLVPEEYDWTCCAHCPVPEEGYPPPCHPPVR